MDFEELKLAPYFIVLLAMLGVVFWLCERRRLRLLDQVIPISRASQILPAWRSWASKARAFLFIVGMALLAIALLKPYDGMELKEISRKGVDIYLLVDLSESMRAQDIRPSRMERARREIKDFLHLLHGDRVGLIGFAGDAFVFVPLTSDYEAYALFLDELSPDAIPVQGTDIKGAISKAMESFKKLSKASGKAMILITDGEDSVGLDPSITERMRADGIKSYVIGIGTPEGAPIPLTEGGYKTDAKGEVVLSRLNESALQDLALQTGGGYVRSVSGDLDLDQIYRRGIKAAFTDEALATTQKKLPHYQFQIFLFAALIAFVLESLIGNRRRLKAHASQNVLKAIVPLFVLLMAKPAFAINPFDLEKAEQAYSAKDYKGAAQIYRELMVNDPNDPLLAFNLGNSLYQDKKYADADAAYKKALNAKDTQIRKQALYNLGNSAFREEKLEDAIAYYQKALSIDGKYQKAQLNHDFVKKLLEQKKQEQEQKEQDKEKQEQKDQEKQEPDKQEQDKEQNKDQSDEQKQDQQEKGDQQQKDQQQNDQEQKSEQKKDGEEDSQPKDKGQEQDKNEKGEPKNQDKGDGSGEEQKPADQNKEGQAEQNESDQNQSENEKKDGEQGQQMPDENKSGDKGDAADKSGADGDEKQEAQQPTSPEQGDPKNSGSATQGNDTKNEGSGNEGTGFVPGKFDQKADQWLESIGDEPGKALKMLIERQTPAKSKKLEKDW